MDPDPGGFSKVALQDGKNEVNRLTGPGSQNHPQVTVRIIVHIKQKVVIFILEHQVSHRTVGKRQMCRQHRSKVKEG